MSKESTTPAEQVGKRQDDAFDTTGLLLDFLANWKWFVLTVIICGAVAYYYCATIIPTYTVSASVYLNDDSATKSKAVSMSDADPMLNMKTYIDETEIEILKSRNNLVKIVDSLGLAYNYYQVGHVRDIPIYKTQAVCAELDSASLRSLNAPLYVTIDKTDGGYRVHTESRVAGTIVETDDDIKALPHTLHLSTGSLVLSESAKHPELNYTEKIVIKNPTTIAGALSSSLRIEFAENAPTILRITLATPVIENGKDVINTLIDFYNRQILEDKNRSAMQTEAFILDRLVMISGELKDVEERLRDYREAHQISDIDAQTTMNLSQKSTAETQVAEINAQMAILDNLESSVKSQNDYSKPLPNVSEDQTITASIDRYNTMAAAYDKRSANLADDNPQLTESREKLAEQRALVLKNIATAKDGLRSRRSGIASIGGASASRLSAQPNIDKGLQEIFREQSVKVNIYTFLLQKREEIALQKTLATPTAQLIDNPLGSGPVAPNRMFIIGVGILIGLLIPGLVIFVRRLLLPNIKDQEDLERLTSVPIIGEICYDDAKETVVVGQNVASPIAELFRLLRNNINFASSGVNNKVILLTSAISGEGKTFVGLNLAITYALTGKRVIVIGLDIRRPVLARTCGLSNERGITTYLSGQEDDLNSLIFQSTFNDNLYVMPAGPIPPNPNELLMSDRMETVFETLRKEYDYIIVDTSPIGMISDTFLITRFSDIQIYVTRASFSSRKSLKVLHNAVNTKRLPHAYVLLNGVNMTSNSYIYRRYGHYGVDAKRTYGYGYGYSETDHKHKPHSKHKGSLFSFLFKQK